MKTIVALLLLASPCLAQDEVPKCLARVATASGVVLHPDGWIVTAEHVIRGEGDTVDVEVCGKQYKGRVVNKPPIDGIDGATAVKIEATGLEYARIAKEPPHVGDHVEAFGYPRGNFARTEGKILRVGPVMGAFKIPFGYEANVYVQPGSSGGPMFNDSRELIGVLHGVSMDRPGGKMVRSLWIGLTAIQSLVDYSKKQSAGAVVPKKKKHVAYAFVQDGCTPCLKLKADVKAGKYPGIEFRFVTRADRDVMARIKQRGPLTIYENGRTRVQNGLPNVSPCIWIEGTSNVQVGYSGVGGFVNFLKFCVIDIPSAVFGFVGDVIFGSPAPEQSPIGDATPIPEPTPVDEEIAESPESLLPEGGGLPPTDEEIASVTELDMTGVRFIVVANDFLNFPADLKRMLINDLSGPLEAEVKARSGGKASVKVVAKVATPHRFDLFCGAAQASVDKITVFMIVPEANVGFVKGTAIKIAEDKFKPLIDKYLHGVSSFFVPVLERVQSEMVAAMNAALATPEPPAVDVVTGEPLPAKEEEWYWGLLAGLAPILRAAIAKRIKT